MVEFLLLLLPLAAASGWFAAKRSAVKIQQPSGVSFPSYFKGLNYVLNEQPDKAIDVFEQMLEVDKETVETHMALGNLFRRRGEVDRAIRIHQTLIAKTNLTDDQRAFALLELGLDYMKAGLFDRAEDLLKELLDTGHYKAQGLQHLRLIYEQEKEWAACLSIAEQQEEIAGERLGTERAHYYCQLAVLAKASGQIAKAKGLLKKAQYCAPADVRATIMLGQIEMDWGEWQSAIRILRNVERQNTSFLAEIIPLLKICHKKLGTEKRLKEYLQEVCRHSPVPAGLVELTHLIQDQEGDSKALTFLMMHLKSQPSLSGLDHLIDLNIKILPPEAANNMRLLGELVHQMSQQTGTYCCSTCGFSPRELHWQCPSCKSWSSIKPATSQSEREQL